MKKFLLISLISIAIFTSCNRSDDNAFSTTTPVTGRFKISYYWDKKDETSNFSGYTFEFVDGGQINATKAAVTTTGTWSETATKLTLNFTTPALSELNNDWLIQEKTPNLIRLKDDNPAQDDQLHFSKL